MSEGWVNFCVNLLYIHNNLGDLVHYQLLLCRLYFTLFSVERNCFKNSTLHIINIMTK